MKRAWAAIKFWWLMVLLAFDQFLNALAFGWADETFSSRCWRLSSTGKGWDWCRRAVDWLFDALIDQKDHCFESYVSEQLRRQLPPELRG